MKRLIKKWVKLEEEIKNLENKLIKLKNKKNKINPIIEEYLNNNNNNLRINKKNILKFKEKDYYINFNKNYFNKILNEIIDDSEKVNKIIEHIYRNRDIETTKVIYIK